jgi:hypothetical protein
LDEALSVYQDAIALDGHSGRPQQRMSDGAAFCVAYDGVCEDEVQVGEPASRGRQCAGRIVVHCALSGSVARMAGEFRTPHLTGGRYPRLGHFHSALAALGCERVQLRGLGCDERGCSQRNRLSLVRTRTPRRSRHGVQRREYRRRDFPALLGSCDWHAGIFLCSHSNKLCHGIHGMASCPVLWLAEAASALWCRARTGDITVEQRPRLFD